ncbi:hypothetical protein [Mycobacteroides abscessus]|uniref:hypothetical protein n=1 Tax=Mycobacteroides abscessus TaxID=36809 RepID=UPI000C268283|nr:hypothetical protein [Mycobacteroides abscessus]
MRCQWLTSLEPSEDDLCLVRSLRADDEYLIDQLGAASGPALSDADRQQLDDTVVAIADLKLRVLKIAGRGQEREGE